MFSSSSSSSSDSFQTAPGGLYFVIWRNIATFCDMPELYCLGLCSRTLNEVCDHPPLWTALLGPHSRIEYYNNENSNSENSSKNKNSKQRVVFDDIEDLDLRNGLKEWFFEKNSSFPKFLKQFFHINYLRILHLVGLELSSDSRLSEFVSWWPVTTVNSSASSPSLSISPQNFAAGNKLIVTSPVRHSSPTVIFVQKFRIETQREFERVSPPHVILMRRSVVVGHITFENIGFVEEDMKYIRIVMSFGGWLIFMILSAFMHTVFDSIYVNRVGMMISFSLSGPDLESTPGSVSAEPPSKLVILFEILLFIVPHVVLASYGGGYFGNFYTVKRLRWIEASSKVIFACLEVILYEFLIVSLVENMLVLFVLILWLIPFWVITTVMFMFVSSLFLLSSQMGKKIVRIMIFVPSMIFVRVALKDLPDELDDKIFNQISNVIVSILANKTAQKILVFICLLVVALYHLIEWVPIMEWIGNVVFGIPPDVDSLSIGMSFWSIGVAHRGLLVFQNNKKLFLTVNSAGSIFIFFVNGVLRNFVSYLLFDNRTDCLLNYHLDHPRFSTDKLEKEKYRKQVESCAFWQHFWKMTVVFVCLRFRWASLTYFNQLRVKESMWFSWASSWFRWASLRYFNQQRVQESTSHDYRTHLMYECGFFIARALILSLGSDLYRLCILKKSFDHEMFRNSRLLTDHPEDFDDINLEKTDPDDDDSSTSPPPPPPTTGSLAHMMNEFGIDV